MARAKERLLDRVRSEAWGCGGEELPNHAQMAAHFLDENVREHRVHAGFRCRSNRRRGLRRRLGNVRCLWITIGERLGSLHQLLHVDLQRPADFELLDELRQRPTRLRDEQDHARRGLEGLVDDLVQQILDAPRELADELRADHAAAALQRVKRAARGDQRFGVRAVIGPRGEIALNARDLLLGFLDEHLDDLGVGTPLFDLHDAAAAARSFLDGGGAGVLQQPTRQAQPASLPADSRAGRGSARRCRACTRDLSARR
jgi:hypothetical protein